MALTQKEISARNYRNRKENGMCPRCGKLLDRDGHYCSSCTEKYRIYHKENRDFFRANHLCTECGINKVPNGERICPECRAKIQSHKKPLTEDQKERYLLHSKSQKQKLYYERIETGLCTRCGKRKAEPGKRKCAICLEYDAELHRMKRLDDTSIREQRKKNHLCYFCGSEIDLPNGNICSRCSEKFRENGEKYGGKNIFWKQENKLIFGGRKNE